MARLFEVGITRDLLRADGTDGPWGVGLDVLHRHPGVRTVYLGEDAAGLRPDHVRGLDALALFAPKVTGETLRGADCLAILARLGVGYDSVDIAACTRHGVLVTITPDAVRRPMATAILAMMLGLSHRQWQKDRITRAGHGWSRRSDYFGMGLTGRVLGSIGLGNIGREVFVLARPLEMRHLAYAPRATAAQAAPFGVELVTLETLLHESDVLVVACPLTPETHHLLDAERLTLLKPTAFVVNAARGPIIDQAALTDALRAERIAGAALDVFEQEPVDAADPILGLENVILSPHALCWTDECARQIGRSAAEAILDVAAGRVPRHVVNREAIETPRVREKLRRYREQAEAA